MGEGGASACVTSATSGSKKVNKHVSNSGWKPALKSACGCGYGDGDVRRIT